MKCLELKKIIDIIDYLLKIFKLDFILDEEKAFLYQYTIEMRNNHDEFQSRP